MGRNGLVALVDSQDADLVVAHTWRPQIVRGGEITYARTTIEESTLTMHVLVMGKPWVDHINHNGLDNRRVNLRPSSRSQNGANRRKLGTFSSLYKGVTWNKMARKWKATVTRDKRQRHLGYFTDEIAAARAYDSAAVELFGEYAQLNFPNKS